MNIGPLHIGLAEWFAVLGAVFAAATYAMQTMVPLRIAGIISNVFFILFGYFSKSYPTLFLYLLLLPLNASGAPMPTDVAALIAAVAASAFDPPRWRMAASTAARTCWGSLYRFRAHFSH